MKIKRLMMGGPVNGERLEVRAGAREFFISGECYKAICFELLSGSSLKLETVFIHSGKNSHEALLEWKAMQTWAHLT